MPRLIAILGPTASGKSDAAVVVARQLGAEILSCDSMMVYQGLDIGTAKPTVPARLGVPHHLIDVVSPAVRYSLQLYLADARRVLDGCHDNGRPVILCGGTGLYAKALTEGYRLRPSDPEMAAKVRCDYERHGAAALLAELEPTLARRVRANPRRLCRAVEAARLCSDRAAGNRGQALPGWELSEFVLMPEPAWTRAKVCRRTESMFRRGWMDEVVALMGAGLAGSPTASQALGYAQIMRFLTAESGNEDALVERINVATCRYAKRQRTWFRHQHPRAQVIPVTGTATGETLGRAILSRLG